MSVRSSFLLIGAAGLMTAGAVAWTGGGADSTSRLVPRLARASSVLPARCSPTVPSRIPAESWTLARRELAPPRPIAIRLCRYAGLGARPPLRLVRSVLRSNPSLIGTLVSELDRLPSAKGAFACPADDGSRILLLLAYPGDHAVTISVGLRGCHTVTNGSVYRSAAGIGSPPAFGPQLVTELKRLTAPRRASPQLRPPAPLVSTLGITRSATLVSYCWMQTLPGGGGRGVCADGMLGRAVHTLRWQPGRAVLIDLRLPAHDVQVEAARITDPGRPARHVLALRTRRTDRTGRRWITHLPASATSDTDLVISARFENGDLTADLGIASGT
jgi:hypothetical protein